MALTQPELKFVDENRIVAEVLSRHVAPDEPFDLMRYAIEIGKAAYRAEQMKKLEREAEAEDAVRAATRALKNYYGVPVVEPEPEPEKPLPVEQEAEEIVDEATPEPTPAVQEPVKMRQAVNALRAAPAPSNYVMNDEDLQLYDFIKKHSPVTTLDIRRAFRWNGMGKVLNRLLLAGKISVGKCAKTSVWGVIE